MTESNINREFLAILPAIERYARVYFRRLSADRLEDALAEVRANCFVAYHRLAERGETDRAYPSALARFAVQQFRAGRRIGNRWRKNELFLAAAPEWLPTESDGRINEDAELAAALVDRRSVPVPVQAGFRMDFPRWLASLQPTNRAIAVRLALGDTTAEAAQEVGVSPARVSQVGRLLSDQCYAFHALPKEREAARKKRGRPRLAPR